MRILSNTQRPLAVFEAWIRAREYRKIHGGPLLIIDEHGNPVLYKYGKKKGEPKKFRLVIVVPGGGMSCVVSAGEFEELQEQGYANDAIGYFPISGGLANVLAFACGKSHRVRSFYEELPKQGFISLFRMLDPRMLLVDLVIDPMLEMLDYRRLRECQAEIYTAVTEWLTGRAWVVRIPVEEDSSQWRKKVRAALTLPKMSPPVELTGIIPGEPNRKALFCDGAVGMPLPLGEAIKLMRPTHVLVLAARDDLEPAESVTFSWITQLGLSWGVPPATKKGTLAIDDGTNRAFARMCEIHPRIECTALIPKSSISLFESNPALIHAAGERGKELMHECLEQAQKAVNRHRHDLVT